MSEGYSAFDPERHAYAVVVVDGACFLPDHLEGREWVAAHELGHALGLRHDEFTMLKERNPPDWELIKDYGNFGYLNTHEHVYTLMSYHDTCGHPDCVPANVFSYDGSIVLADGRRVKVGDRYHNSTDALREGFERVSDYRGGYQHDHSEL